MVIAYPIGTSGQNLVLDDEVLEHFSRHRQLRFWQREAGGLLFARLAPGAIEVLVATGPRSSDRRCRYSYRGDRNAEQREILEYYARDLHFVGSWHTHPERYPMPSRADRRTMHEAVNKSQHRLNAFVLAIVGQAAFPAGLNISLFSPNSHHVLQVVQKQITAL